MFALAVVQWFLGVAFAQDDFSQAIETPYNITESSDHVVLIAVVDDAFNIDHPDVKDFLFTNSAEVPDNGIDDDSNGFTDDWQGFDVADGDGDVSAPIERMAAYSHGTYLTGITVRLLRQMLGENANTEIKILPVKVLADDSSTGQLEDSYTGIKYALGFKPDVILAAWGVQHVTDDHKSIISQAYESGAVVVAAAGNNLVERDEYPAMLDTVIAVSATDNNGTPLRGSNHGSFVDISAPGKDISGTAYSQHTSRTSTGTSPATAMAAAAVAAMRVVDKQIPVDQIAACMINNSTFLNIQTPELHGRYGSGMLNIERAMACAREREPVTETNLQRTKGIIPLSNIDSEAIFSVEPIGDYNGVRYFSRVPNKTQKSVGTMQFSATASPFHVELERPLVPGLAIEVASRLKHFKLRTNNNPEIEAYLQYEMKTIDHTKRFCHGTVLVDSELLLSDGSGGKDYAYYSDCKWQIIAPKGKLIRVTTEEISTEPNTDQIMFFNGTKTNQDIVAVLSGIDRPPQFTSWSNELLVWFLSDHKTQLDGWKLKIEFVDP